MSMVFFEFPFSIDATGKSATTKTYEEHIKNLIEQTLFTSPGERVNRPNFGCGLQQVIFEPNSEIISISMNTLVQSSLNMWLNHLILVDSVEITPNDSLLEVTVKYTILRTLDTRVSNFKREY
jgi:phage baseplate assembly protein W